MQRFDRPLLAGQIGGLNIRCGSLCRALHSDPYAQVATMRRSCEWPHDFSYEDGPRGPATCSHSFGRHEHSLCAVPACDDPVCSTATKIIARLCGNPEQSGSPANVGVVASRSRSSAPEVRRPSSRSATGDGDCPLRRKSPYVQKLCRGPIDRTWVRAAQFLDLSFRAPRFCT